MMSGIYHIVATTDAEINSEYLVTLDDMHPLFRGHFPQFPIVPGAVMVEMVKELFEKKLHKKLRLKEASQIKFLRMIIPNHSTPIKIHLKLSGESDYKLSAEIELDGAIYFKMVAVYEECID